MLTRKYLMLLYLALMLVSVESIAQEKQTMSIDDCVTYALKNSNSIKTSKLNEEEAKANVKAILGLGLPQLNGDVTVMHNIKIQTTFLPDFISPAVYGVLFQEGLLAPKDLGAGQSFPAQFGIKNTASATLSLSQLIFSGSYFVGLEASKTYVQLLSQQADLSENQVVENVKKAAYSTLVAIERAGLIDANIERLNNSLSEVKAMNEQGFVEKIDVDRLEVTRNNLISEKQKLEQLIALSWLALKYQMGMPLQTELELTDKLNDVVAASIKAEPVNEQVIVSNRPEMIVMETARNLAEIDLKNNRVTRYPSLAGFGNFGVNAGSQTFGGLTDFEQNWFGNSLIGVKMSIPIFDGFQRKNNIAQAKIRLDKAEIQKADLSNALELGGYQAQISINNSIKTLAAQKANMELAQEVARITKIKFSEGIGSNLEVLNAESALKEAQTNYFAALYDYLIAKVDLEKSQGKLKQALKN